MDGSARSARSVWSEVQRLRCQFAQQIDELEPEAWNAPSWCAGWRVRDVVGHLVHLAEATQLSMLRDVLGHGALPDRAISQMARQLGRQPVSSLTSRLRAAADGRFHVLGFPPAVALGDVLVHSCDALRPLGRDPDTPPEDVAPVLNVYRWFGRMAFHAAPLRVVHLEATDLDWEAGKGPAVRGRAIDLLLVLANRGGVLDAVDGPGVTVLRRFASDG